ncbi:hypothetical protein OIDMADRAFT_184786 [Oidiodendron maius Zn]|uniref:F-box domain-containing protein n=1 Tax=Oidiodendron maius (strain Zn) TaxID=913774 RepID=A0A0C3GS14_OIDMZ|nr:hypothetical protein OIDMADRAFT_184786 [Oidiodendron maius Zn]
MGQQRITLFFPLVSRKKTSPSATSPFLELPFSIRRQIYHEAGLVSGKTINMNSWAMRKKVDNRHRQAFDHGDDADLPPVPLSLFTISRLINDEASQIFYGENQFAITGRARRGLRALELFSNSGLAKFRSLTIRLNIASCDMLCCGDRERRCGNSYIDCSKPSSHDMLLSYASTPDQLIISQWHQICSRLSNGIQPSTLALYVICDCEDRQTVDMIVKPLLTLPILRDFGLRLAREYDKELQGVAKDTVLRLTRRWPSQSLPHFRFLDLPKEIQLKILEQTSLVYNYETTCAQDHMRYGGTCSSKGIPHAVITPDCYLLKCFCCRGHSAFNFRCSHCDSLGFPHGLFLDSREFRDAAVQVFYGRNEFAVSMVGLVPSPASLSQDGSISIIPGLQQFPKCSIQFFAVLRLDFEPSELEMLQPNQAGWKTWLNTTDLLSKAANLAILNLEIRFSEKIFNSVWDMSETNAGYEKMDVGNVPQADPAVDYSERVKELFRSSELG